jgi:hypothetical protein
MAALDIVQTRLRNQHLARQSYDDPARLVEWLGAVQAQDYPAAKWAVGQRVRGSTDASIEQAVADGSILRTHVLRPTWHFVPAADIRWMLALTAPRIKAAGAHWHRRLGLDGAFVARSYDALARALEGGKHMTRPQLAAALERAGIATKQDDLVRYGFIFMQAELDAVLCSGPTVGKQTTYALLEERAPKTAPLERDEALARLAGRYFASHGPATLHDFVWWSGLTVADARAGLEMARPQLAHEDIEGRTYWFSEGRPAAEGASQEAYLLPNYDEYIVGYTNRNDIFDSAHVEKLDSRGNVLFNHTIVIDGRIAGTWKRALKKDTVVIEASPFAPLGERESRALAAAAERYAAFMGVQLRMR